jgi:short-subunit dehydrogenase
MGINNNTFALVTGSSSGIGFAISKELASRNNNLIMHSLPDQGLSDICLELERQYNIKTLFFEIDLTTEDGPQSFFEYVKSKHCKVNILVNNAGIGFEGPIESYTRNQIDCMILLNIRALTLMTSYFTPELKTHKESYILNIGSFGCYIPTAYKSIYLASKSYIYYFTRALESELKGTSVHACVIVPSGAKTNKIVLERIERSGWFSRKSALSPEEVANIGIKGMLRGKKIIIPGILINLVFRFGLLVPEGIILVLTRRMFKNYK